VQPIEESDLPIFAREALEAVHVHRHHATPELREVRVRCHVDAAARATVAELARRTTDATR